MDMQEDPSWGDYLYDEVQGVGRGAVGLGQTAYNMGLDWLSLIPQGIVGITELIRTNGDFEMASGAIQAVSKGIADKLSIHASETGNNIQDVIGEFYTWARNNITDDDPIGNAIVDGTMALLPFKTAIGRGVSNTAKSISSAVGKGIDRLSEGVAKSVTGYPAKMVEGIDGTMPAEVYAKLQVKYPNTPVSQLTPEQIATAVAEADAAYVNPVQTVRKRPLPATPSEAIANDLNAWAEGRLNRPTVPTKQQPPEITPIPTAPPNVEPSKEITEPKGRTTKPRAETPTTPYDIPFNTPKEVPTFKSGSMSNLIDSPYLRALKVFGGENHPMVASLMKLETSTIMKRGKYQPLEREFETAWRKLPSRLKPEVHDAILRNDIERATRLMSNSRALKNPAAAGELMTKVRSALDERYKEIETSGVPIEYREKFFPRKLMDPEGFSTELNKIIKEKRGEIGPEAVRGLNEMNAKLQDLTEQVRAGKMEWSKYQGEIDKILTGDVLHKVADPKSMHTKERTLNGVPRKLQKFYASPDFALPEYFTDTAKLLAEREFLGKGYDTVENGISNKLASELARGTMDSKQALEFKKILQERFSPTANRGSSPTVRALKNVGYMGTIANFASSAIQALDVLPSAARFGVINTIKGILPGTKKLKASDLGLFEIAQEIEHSGGRGNVGWKPGFSERALRSALITSGFKGIDRFGKNVTLTAAANKNASLAKSTKGVKELERRGWRHIHRTPEEWSTFVDALKAKDMKNPLVQEAALYELLQVQPIALSHQPISWLRHPNGRIAYMLKTWAIRQMNVIREDMAKGNYMRAGKFLGAMTASAMLAPALKDMVVGAMNLLNDHRTVKEQADDSTYDKFIAALLRISFLGDKYTMTKAAQGDPSKLVAGAITPPAVSMFFSVVGDAIKYLDGGINNIDEAKSKRYIPYIGSYLQRTNP